ncbi:MAG: hypothetical protein U9N77_00900, partial [Thermodesulfobacteriota bacterium]|nr:hypothetical protein [Thermodesulfobacteriota bacterium]
PILLNAEITLPDGFLIKEEFVGKSADAIYEIIKTGQAEESENSSANKNVTQNKSKDSGQEEESDDETLTDKREEKELNDDGSGTGDPGKAGEVRDNLLSQENEGNSDSELNWNEIMIHAASYARGTGNLPGSIDRLIQKKINPRLNWKELLARFSGLRQERVPTNHHLARWLNYMRIQQKPWNGKKIDKQANHRPKKLASPEQKREQSAPFGL